MLYLPQQGPRNSVVRLRESDKPTCFVVRDDSGQKLDHVYFEDELTRRLAAKLPTKAEARRIADNIATLPGLVNKTAEPKTVKSSWW